MTNLIECKNNWVIVDVLDDISDINQLISEVDSQDYSEFTTAMNGSIQKFFYNPHPFWKPNHTLKTPESFSNIKSKYEKIISNYLKHYNKFLFESKNLELTTAWTVTGYKGSYHTPHDHGLNGISSVIYTKTLNHKSPIDNGPIYFILNSDEYDLLYSPYQRMPRFVPEEKMILIFPSWTIHGTLPQGDGERTTISFDLSWK